MSAQSTLYFPGGFFHKWGHKLFKFRVFFTGASVLVGLSLAFFLNLQVDKTIALFSSLFTIIYFMNSHALEKARFSFETFQNFNDEFRELNEDLNRIAEIEGNLPREDRDKVMDYFNLCAEEFLLCRNGYVAHEVWVAWASGMAYFFRKSAIKELWAKEGPQRSSYYGFDPKRLGLLG